jgi:HupE / UreJ protein
MKRQILCWLHAALLVLMSSTAQAHKASDAYLQIDADTGALTVRLDVALRDLDAALPLDANQDGVLTWGEVKAQDAPLRQLLSGNLALERDGKKCPLVWQPFALEERSDGTYLVAQSAQHCGTAGNAVMARYALLRDIDATHRAIVTARQHGKTFTRILDPRSGQAAMIGDQSVAQAFRSFVADGVHHILIGYDHIAFLLILLLPMLLAVKSSGLGATLRQTVGTITAFTIAHSITLALAAFAIVDPPSVWVELAIAVTILLAALNNLKKFLPGPPAGMAFAFGLIHGFGFAGALREAALPQDAFVAALLGFNVGVELGQLMIVTVWVGVVLGLQRLTRSRATMAWSMRGGSMAVSLLAGVWIVQRLP